MAKEEPQMVINNEINEKYSKISQFRGATMDVNLQGQLEMKKIISTRLTSENADKLAIILSSNFCENYFGVLVEFSEGKILNLD